MTRTPGSRVLLVRASQPVRLQLRRLLREVPGLEVVGQTLGTEPLAPLVHQTGADWLIADARPGAQTTPPSLPGLLVGLPDTVRGLVALVTTPAIAAGRLPDARITLIATPEDLTQERADGAFATALRGLLQGRTSADARYAPTIPSAPVIATAPRTALAKTPYDFLAIGASTGGPQALQRLMGELRGRLSVPLLITQHLSDGFTQALATRLEETSGIPTVVAQEGLALRAGHAFVAPASRHLTVAREGAVDRCRLDDGAPEHFCKPAVDVMLRSLARLPARRCLVVILTGMGQDGLRGCEALVAQGGTVLAQDEASSVVWGMPGSVARAGLARRVLPLDALGAAVLAELGLGEA